LPVSTSFTGFTVGGAAQFSTANAVASSVAAGAAEVTSKIMTFVRGIWRISLSLGQITEGAKNSASSGQAVILSLFSPVDNSEAYIGVLAGGGANGNPQNLFFDSTFHFPLDGYYLSVLNRDPVTALSISRVTASVYACRLL